MLDIDYEQPEPENIPKDVTPPSLTLQGGASLQVAQGAMFVDPGVLAVDVEDGLITDRVAVKGLAQLTAALASKNPASHGAVAPDNPSLVGPFVLIYTVKDLAGNAAEPALRSVFVDVSCPAQEQRCTSSGECSTGGVCLSGVDPKLLAQLRGLSSEPAVQPYVPPIDTIPPVISAFGDGPSMQTPDRVRFVVTTTRVGASYADAGATAEDNVDGNLTDAVSRRGLKAVQTQFPTPLDQPFVVTYDVQDAAGNQAMPVRRRVIVACPDGEQVCQLDGTRNYCSTSGICGVVPTVEARPVPRPLLLLQGPSVVRIPIGSAFGACPRPRPLSLVCDLGARAEDVVEGDLTPQVEACSTDTDRFLFRRFGLRGCRIDTSKAGVFHIKYSVEDSTGGSAAIQRTVVVSPTCPAGERLCPDISCSSSQLCAQENGPLEGVIVPTDTPPQIQLIMTADLPQVVQLKRGTEFAACAEGQLPTAAVPCELGATANDGEDGNITHRILTCPPDSCLELGCIGHEFRSKGIQGCGYNSMARIGTVVRVAFVIFDNAMPAQKATVVRELLTVNPCTAEEHFCEDDNSCSSVPCDSRGSLPQDAPPPQPPVISFLLSPANTSLAYTPCGAAPATGLQPCESAAHAANGSCGVHAVEVVDGQARDVSSSLLVQQDTNCTLLQVAKGICTLCGLSSLQLGRCPPGTYSLLYSARSPSTLLAATPARRTVVVTPTAAQVPAAATVLLQTPAATTARQAQLAAQLQQRLALANPILALLHLSLAEHANTTLSAGCRARLSHAGALDLRVSGTASFAADGGAVSLPLTLSVAFNSSTNLTATDAELQARAEPLRACAAELLDRMADAGALPGAGSTLAVAAGVASATVRRQSAGQVQLCPAINIVQVSLLGAVEGLATDARILGASIPEPSEFWVSATPFQAKYSELSSEFCDLVAALLRGVADTHQLSLQAGESLGLELSDSEAGVAALLAAQSECESTLRLQLSAAASSNSSAAADGGGSTSVIITSSASDDDDTVEILSRSAVFQIGQGHLSARHLLQATSASPSPAGSSAQPSNHPLPRPARGVVRDRLLGASNRIIGGVLLHQQRQTLEPGCAKRFGDLASLCSLPGVVREIAFMLSASDLSPFGTDPVFNPLSTLYNEALEGHVGTFYNSSVGSDEVSLLGQPFPWHPRHVPGLPLGFPMLLSVEASDQRLQQLLTYVSDSHYVDTRTRSLSLHVLTYNAALRTFGVVDGTFTRQPWGIFTGQIHINEMPELVFDMGSASRRFMAASDILALVLVALHLLYLVEQLLLQLWHVLHRRLFPSSTSHIPRLAISWFAVDCLAVTLQLLAVRFYILSIVKHGDLVLELDTKYTIYDDVESAPARFFLPAKLDWAGSSDAAVPNTTSDLLPLCSEQNMQHHVASARWVLPDNETDLARLGSLYRDVHSIQHHRLLYTQCASLALMMMVLRMLHVWASLPEMQVIVKSLGLGMGSVVDLLSTGLVFTALLTVYCNVLFGDRLEVFETLSGTFRAFVVWLVSAWYDTLRESLLDNDIEWTPLENFLLHCVYFFTPLLLTFFILQLVLGAMRQSMALTKYLTGHSARRSHRPRRAAPWRLVLHPGRQLANRALQQSLPPEKDRAPGSGTLTLLSIKDFVVRTIAGRQTLAQQLQCGPQGATHWLLMLSASLEQHQRSIARLTNPWVSRRQLRLLRQACAQPVEVPLVTAAQMSRLLRCSRRCELRRAVALDRAERLRRSRAVSWMGQLSLQAGVAQAGGTLRRQLARLVAAHATSTTAHQVLRSSNYLRLLSTTLKLGPRADGDGDGDGDAHVHVERSGAPVNDHVQYRFLAQMLSSRRSRRASGSRPAAADSAADTERETHIEIRAAARQPVLPLSVREQLLQQLQQEGLATGLADPGAAAERRRQQLAPLTHQQPSEFQPLPAQGAAVAGGAEQLPDDAGAGAAAKQRSTARKGGEGRSGKRGKSKRRGATKHDTGPYANPAAAAEVQKKGSRTTESAELVAGPVGEGTHRAKSGIKQQELTNQVKRIRVMKRKGAGDRSAERRTLPAPSKGEHERGRGRPSSRARSRSRGRSKNRSKTEGKEEARKGREHRSHRSSSRRRQGENDSPAKSKRRRSSKHRVGLKDDSKKSRHGKARRQRKGSSSRSAREAKREGASKRGGEFKDALPRGRKAERRDKRRSASMDREQLPSVPFLGRRPMQKPLMRLRSLLTGSGWRDGGELEDEGQGSGFNSSSRWEGTSSSARRTLLGLLSHEDRVRALEGEHERAYRLDVMWRLAKSVRRNLKLMQRWGKAEARRAAAEPLTPGAGVGQPSRNAVVPLLQHDDENSPQQRWEGERGWVPVEAEEKWGEDEEGDSQGSWSWGLKWLMSRWTSWRRHIRVQQASALIFRAQAANSLAFELLEAMRFGLEQLARSSPEPRTAQRALKARDAANLLVEELVAAADGEELQAASSAVVPRAHGLTPHADIPLMASGLSTCISGEAGMSIRLEDAVSMGLIWRYGVPRSEALQQLHDLDLEAKPAAAVRLPQLPAHLRGLDSSSGANLAEPAPSMVDPPLVARPAVRDEGPSREALLRRQRRMNRLFRAYRRALRRIVAMAGTAEQQLRELAECQGSLTSRLLDMSVLLLALGAE